MRKPVSVTFFEKYLREVSGGRGYREHKSPVVLFKHDAMTGKYNDIPDDLYAVMACEAEELSEFWLDQDKQTASEILKTVLENIDMDKESVHKIADLLAECYLSTERTPVLEYLMQGTEKLENSDDEDLADNNVTYEDFDDEDLVEEDSSAEESSSVENSGEETEPPIYDGIPDNESIPKISEYFKDDDFEEENEDDDFECDNFDDEIEDDESGSDTKNDPRKIYDWLEKRIYGQKEAVKAASMILYNHMKGRKRNVLFVGPTGCGKTEIWRALSKKYSGIKIIDSSMISGEGWAGSFKVNNIFDDMSRQEAEHAIFVFDEFDKLCEPQVGASGTNHSQIIQNGLLKLIEGTTVSLKKFKVDTSKISFVFCGSFERLTEMKSESGKSIGFGAEVEKQDKYSVYENQLNPEDFVRYGGMRPEIAGRINQIIRLQPMTAESYKAILEDDLMSPLRQLERQYDIKLCLDKDAEERLTEEAAETRMGVRYLRSRIQEMLDDQMFRDCSKKEYMLGA